MDTIKLTYTITNVKIMYLFNKLTKQLTHARTHLFIFFLIFKIKLTKCGVL